VHNRIENLVKDYKIYIDGTSFSCSGAEDFFYKKLAPVLVTNKKQVIVLKAFAHKVRKILTSNSCNSKAKRAHNILSEYSKYNLLILKGRKRKNKNYHEMCIKEFKKSSKHFRLLLITQDKKLAFAVDSLNKTLSKSKVHKIITFRVIQNGELKKWNFNNPLHQKQSFKVCTVPKIDTGKIIYNNPEIPSEGCSVYSKKFGKLKLKKLIAKGGEAAVYKTKSNLACKIYFPHRLTEFRIEKLNLLVKKQVQIEGVCWPIDTVENRAGQTVGCVMKLAKGDPLQTILLTREDIEKKFPNWNRKHLVELCITILEKIQKLHNQGILIGDINPLNILVKSESCVYFVDTDSYQVEGYPCPVGTVVFTAPEIQGKNFSSFLRTMEHEKYAVGTLIFMILMLGKKPYSHQGSSDPAKDIKKAVFSYPLGSMSNRKTPYGPWKYIWSHMPYKVKKAFYDTFANGIRTDVDEWLKLMKSYRYSLEKGLLDPTGESIKLFPTTYKMVSSYAKKQYGAEENFITYVCDKCGAKFSVSKRLQNKMEGYSEKYCSDCLMEIISRASNLKGSSRRDRGKRSRKYLFTKI